MKTLRHPNTVAAVAGTGVIAAGLYVTDGNPAAWALAGTWAIVATVGVIDARR